MERLESYVPGGLLQRVQRAAGNDRAAACAAFRGATLFVDISGYTALAETLSNQGSAGVEQLGKVLDQVFRAHVRAIHDCAGEIAHFAGDALLAYWAADDGDLGRAMRGAEDCARLLHLTPWLDADTLPHAPRLHIGIGGGDLWTARLGGDHQWQVLLAGHAVRQAGAASRAAGAGETVVAPETEPFRRSFETASASAVLAGRTIDAESAVLGSTDGRSTLEAPDVEAHVPKRVQEFATEGYSAWIPQRRTICALFVRIEGLDETAPDAFVQHQAVVSSLHVALRPFAGSSGTLQLDDKGLVFTLCLGVPYDAHADDALRAVRAGLAVQSELGRLGLNSAAGVASGYGVCMPLGGPQRRLYWSGGRFMHVAARLMEAAGTGLLCTENVADQVRRAVSLSPERPLTVKGVRWPVRVFRAVGSSYVYDEPGVLYGRAEEQAVLQECLHAVASGQGSVLWMVGEAGLGKTALVHSLRQMAAQHGIPFLTGAAGSVGMAAPYAAWRSVFSSLLDSTDSPADRRARVDGIRHRQFAPLVNAVVPGFLEETAVVQSLSGQTRADATSTVLSEVLALHASGRFVLVLEDCHWMDSASWRLALRVAQDHPEALILLTSRPGTDVQELNALQSLERYREMKLSPLRPVATGSLVESVLQGHPASRELVEEITERSMGNPLFAREYALLLASRLNRRDPGSTSAAPRRDYSGAMPTTVESLISSRLDALPPAEDLALKAASVIGDSFSVETIRGVYPGELTSDGALEILLAKLAERQLIVRHERTVDAYAFHHALIREVTYRQLTREQRCTLHRRCAERIEARYTHDLGPHVAVLAHHWSNAELPSLAIKYTDQAAAQALGAGAFEEAERLLGSCIELAKREAEPIEPADMLRWYRQLADARRGMGYLEPRKDAAHVALGVAGISRPDTFLPLAVNGIGCLWQLATRGRFTRGRPVPHEHTMDVARAFRHSAEVCYFQNELFGMLSDSLSAVAYATALGPSAVLVGALTEFGGIMSVGGLRRTGERILDHAIDMAEAADDQAAQAYGHMINCLYYIGQGDWTAAEKSCCRCQDLCEPMDDRVNWTNAQAVRFWMSHYRGHVGAEDAARNLLHRAGETGNRQHRAWALRCLAVCALREDRFEDALTHLKAAHDALKDTAALNERLPTLGLLSFAQWRTGDRSSAHRSAEDALVHAATVRRPLGQGSLEGYSALATVALEAWEQARSTKWENVGSRKWKDASEACLRVLRRYSNSFPIGEARYAMHRGDYWRILGRAERARRSYRRGKSAARRLGMPWEAGRCKLALKRLDGAER